MFLKRPLKLLSSHFTELSMQSILKFGILLMATTNVMALNVAITATTENASKPTVVGTTNLPDGIELMVTLTRKESNFMAQDKAKVMQGKFRAGPFSQKGQPLNPGAYLLEVMTPIASVQPPATWPVIGNDGDKLGGPLTKKDSFGGRIAQFKTTVKIGDGKPSGSLDQAAREQDKKDKHAWWLQSCKDICKMAQSLAQKRGESFNNDRCYYKCVADEGKK